MLISCLTLPLGKCQTYDYKIQFLFPSVGFIGYSYTTNAAFLSPNPISSLLQVCNRHVAWLFVYLCPWLITDCLIISGLMYLTRKYIDPLHGWCYYLLKLLSLSRAPVLILNRSISRHLLRCKMPKKRANCVSANKHEPGTWRNGETNFLFLFCTVLVSAFWV